MGYWKGNLFIISKPFNNWIRKTKLLENSLSKLSELLFEYLKKSLSTSEVPNHENFFKMIPEILSNCDKLNFQDQHEVNAYTYYHFLERYRKILNILAQLMENNLLPLRSNGIEVIDIGAGPSPTFFALNDFYKALKRFSKKNKFKGKIRIVSKIIKQLPKPKYHVIEKSSLFVNLTKNISQKYGLSNFELIKDDISNLNIENLRWDYDDETLNKYRSEYIEKENIESIFEIPKGKIEVKFRYNISIISNFLTNPSVLTIFEKELLSTIKSIRFGGVVIMIGGADDNYENLFRIFENKFLSIFKDKSFVREDNSVFKKEESIVEIQKINFSDQPSQIMREFYQKVWNFIEEDSGKDLSKYRNEKFPHLWDKNSIPTKTNSYRVRIYRKMPIKQ